MKLNNTEINPWINIPASDYEGHMDSPAVGQLKFLGELFKDVLKNFEPASVAVPGCATGNGFGYIDFNITKKVLAIDINPEYIKILRERFKSSLQNIETVCADLDSFEFGERKFDLVHCALVFEYIDTESFLKKTRKALNKNGRMTVLLQLPYESSSPVSATGFTSLKSLEGFIRLLMPEEFNTMAVSNGFRGDSEKILTLESGKTFWFGTYTKE